MLEWEYGVVVVRSSENIGALAARKWASKLEIYEKESVLMRERFVFDAGDRPVEYNVGYYRFDRFIYSIDSKKA